MTMASGWSCRRSAVQGNIFLLGWSSRPCVQDDVPQWLKGTVALDGFFAHSIIYNKVIQDLRFRIQDLVENSPRQAHATVPLNIASLPQLRKYSSMPRFGTPVCLFIFRLLVVALSLFGSLRHFKSVEISDFEREIILLHNMDSILFFGIICLLYLIQTHVKGTLGTNDFDAYMFGIKFWKDDEKLRPVYKKLFYKTLSGFLHFGLLVHRKYTRTLPWDEHLFFL